MQLPLCPPNLPSTIACGWQRWCWLRNRQVAGRPWCTIGRHWCCRLVAGGAHSCAANPSVGSEANCIGPSGLAPAMQKVVYAPHRGPRLRKPLRSPNNCMGRVGSLGHAMHSLSLHFPVCIASGSKAEIWSLEHVWNLHKVTLPDSSRFQSYLQGAFTAESGQIIVREIHPFVSQFQSWYTKTAFLNRLYKSTSCSQNRPAGCTKKQCKNRTQLYR